MISIKNSVMDYLKEVCPEEKTLDQIQSAMAEKNVALDKDRIYFKNLCNRLAKKELDKRTVGATKTATSYYSYKNNKVRIQDSNDNKVDSNQKSKSLIKPDSNKGSELINSNQIVGDSDQKFEPITNSKLDGNGLISSNEINSNQIESDSNDNNFDSNQKSPGPQDKYHDQLKKGDDESAMARSPTNIITPKVVLSKMRAFLENSDDPDDKTLHSVLTKKSRNWQFQRKRIEDAIDLLIRMGWIK